MGEKRATIGIDEVGRGALCGSVTVAAFAFVRRRRFLEGAPRRELKDSKRLTPRGRETWFAYLKAQANAGNVAFATARVSPRVVDRINIRNATNLAATRAYERLMKKQRWSPLRVAVLLDGGLFIHPAAPLAPRAARTIIRGDEKISEIQLASIVAKVTRDRAVVRIAVRHPSYGLAAHKGYGTHAHRIALARHGAIEGFHRLTFVQKFLRVSMV